ncbi:hypothetical protein M9194_19525 [Vibrio sp. S4M6]|uniref:hypothetical protein n=1 Tax=Vibrio sinus TaxID=2946865 RepID=UPI002029E548|nr:hypothetical protein [Vibrio sinus]MCL9783618.1 hypothetical protein [Vibrio sinus]
MPFQYIPKTTRFRLQQSIDGYINSQPSSIKKAFMDGQLTEAKKNTARILRQRISDTHTTVDQAIDAIRICSRTFISLEKTHKARGHGRSEIMIQRCLKILAPFRTNELLIRDIKRQALLKKIRKSLKIKPYHSNSKKRKIEILHWLYMNLSVDGDDLSYKDAIKYIKDAYDSLKEFHSELPKESISNELALLRSLVEQIVPYLKYSDVYEDEAFLSDIEYKKPKSYAPIYHSLPISLSVLNENHRLQKLSFLLFLRYGDPTVVPVRNNQIELNYDRSKDKILGPQDTFSEEALAPDVLQQDTGITDLDVNIETKFRLVINMDSVKYYDNRCPISVLIHTGHLAIFQKARVLVLYNIEEHINKSSTKIERDILWREDVHTIRLSKNIVKSAFKYRRLYKMISTLQDPSQPKAHSPILDNLVNEFFARLSSDGLNETDILTTLQVLDRIRLESMVSLSSILSDVMDNIIRDGYQLTNNVYARLSLGFEQFTALWNNRNIPPANMDQQSREVLTRRLSQTDYNSNNYFSADILFIVWRILQAIGWNSDLLAAVGQGRIKSKETGYFEKALYTYFLVSNNSASENASLVYGGLSSVGSSLLSSPKNLQDAIMRYFSN